MGDHDDPNERLRTAAKVELTIQIPGIVMKQNSNNASSHTIENAKVTSERDGGILKLKLQGYSIGSEIAVDLK